MDYVNDRKILILLSLKHNRTSKEEKRYRVLKERYADNNQYVSELREILITGGYVRILREPIASSLKVNLSYEISETGIKALTNGRFVSELQKSKTEKKHKILTVISLIFGITGTALSIIFNLKNYNSNNNDTTEPAEYPAIKNPKAHDINHDTSKIHSETLSIESTQRPFIDKDTTMQENKATVVDKINNIEQ